MEDFSGIKLIALKDKYRILFKISFLSGAIPFLGGWIIFLLWLAGRYLLAADFENLVILGFFWIMICFFVGCAGLLVLASYVIINRHQLHVRMLLALIVILINIPSVLLIIPWQGTVERKVFIRLSNETERNFSHLTLIGDTFDPVNIGALNKNESKIFNYEPTYIAYGERMYQAPDSLRMVISVNQIQDTSNFPTFNRGKCEHLVIDENLSIKGLY